MMEICKALLKTFYALVFGSRPEMDYLSICDRTWEMEIP